MKCVACEEFFFFLAAAFVLAATCAIAKEDYVKRSGNRWTLGTAGVERTVALEDGKLILKGLKNKFSGQELAAGGGSPEFFLYVGEGTQLVTSADGPWKLVRADQSEQGQGEIQLDLTVRRGPLEVTKSYVIYPGSSVIRQWLAIRNAGDKPLAIAEPGFLDETVQVGQLAATDLHWMTGADNYPGSWLLQTEKLTGGRRRTFDSYQIFPGKESAGFGANVMVRHNDRQVWPAKGWQFLPHEKVTVPMDLTLDLKAGDVLTFAQQWHWSAGSPANRVAFAPVIRYEDGETHSAEKEFGGVQGQNGWHYRYAYLMEKPYRDLAYDAKRKEWCLEGSVPLVNATGSHPGGRLAPLRVWTSPKAGRVRVTAQLCNTGNTFLGEGAIIGRRATSQSYAPWYALLASDTRDGIVIGWDYFGHWASSFEPNNTGFVTATLKVAGYRRAIAPGESVTTPKAFTALFHGDLDDAGNEVLNWQYRYLWDYTREPWFPAIRMLGYWMKGTGWGHPGVGWLGGNPDTDSTFRKVFRVADLMRACGADVYHRDHGWWDRAGDWNGLDFRMTGDYLRKSGMG